MKEIMAVIRPEKYFELRDRLSQSGFNSMSAKEACGRGSAAVMMTGYAAGRGNETYDDRNHPMIAKKLIELYVRDADLDSVIKIINAVSCSGHHGDGKIFVIPVDKVQRIRTGEENDEAIM